MINGRINILTPDVYNKIAAGEVVDQPASAVKELVENSIDAGAHRIIIEIQNGGLGLISVSDNGCGIYEEDLPAVFLKHATSKLQTPDDLISIQTLGFRGEALASIAAISEVTLTSRQVNCDVGVSLKFSDNKIVEQHYVTANVGTKIEVRDLYYNVPARKKFLKSPQHETNEITKFVSKLILTNPNLEITYIVDGKTIYKTNGNGLEESIFVVYGADCLKNCLPINYGADFLSIKGYICKPEASKANSTYQTLSVNGRYITDKNIQGAIKNAYNRFLMTRQYPMFVLDINLPCDVVDVNVHPRKAEVRFQDVNMVAGKFYRAVDQALNDYTHSQVNKIWEAPDEDRDPKFGNSLPLSQNTISYSMPDMMHQNFEVDMDHIREVWEPEKVAQAKSQMPLAEFAQELERNRTIKSARIEMGLDEEDSSVQQPKPQIMPYKPIEPDITDELISRARLLGSAFETYLILQLDDKLILVDQHAAHERILFDKFMEGRTYAMQPLMFPYVFTVKDDEAEFIERNIKNILRAGIEVEPFGKNTFRITAVSVLLEETQMEEFVKYLLSEAGELDLVDENLIVERIAQKACKAAVKAGYRLNELEVRYILKAIYENKILQCPHGRPITTVFTKTQLEKMFKRIV